MKAYVDVRGPWPVLIVGMSGWVLDGAPRSITVQEAKRLVGLEPEPPDVLDALRTEVDKLTPEAVKAQLEKLRAMKAGYEPDYDDSGPRTGA